MFDKYHKGILYPISCLAYRAMKIYSERYLKTESAKVESIFVAFSYFSQLSFIENYNHENDYLDQIH